MRPSTLGLCLIAPLWASTASAASPEPIGVTISGGVSLGAWEAGFMYLFLEAQKARPAAELRIVTGASAGSANAFVSALSSCLPKNPQPMDDPGWLVWGPIGFTDLFDRQRAGESLFVRDPLEAAVGRIRRIWDRGLPETCDVVFGVSVTRVHPRQVRFQADLLVPRSLETFVVRIQGRGMGKPPRLSNYVDPRAPTPAPLLSFLDDESPEATEHNYAELSSVVYASGAFPVAFEAMSIDYCLSKPGEAGAVGDVRCDVPEFTEQFVDGGLMETNPLRLAWNVADRWLEYGATGHTEWRDPLRSAGPAPRPSTRHLYLDPDTQVYPAEWVVGEQPESGLLARLFSFGGGMLESTRARELVQLSAERPGAQNRLHLALNNLPKASEHLYAFLGFFERDFRAFDFYVGMYDAFAEIGATAAWAFPALDFDALIQGDEAVRRGWAPFLCLLSMVDPNYQRLQSQCAGPEQENFRILLQVSLDELYQRCRPREDQPGPPANRGHFHCQRAGQGYTSPEVPGVRALPSSERQRLGDEGRFNFFMRLLGAYEFGFKDLGLTRAEAKEGRLALRLQLDAVVAAWSGAQADWVERILTKTAGRMALHSIMFSPPLVSGYISAGTTIQTGISVVPFGWSARWLQLTAAFQLTSLETLISEPRPRLAFIFSGGPELHLTPLSNSLLQPSVAVRGGVQLGLFDGFSTKACDGSDARDCTQGVLELEGIVTFFERIRVHGIWQTYPALYGQSQNFFRLQFGIGYQFL